MNKQKNISAQPEPDSHEIVAAALNEQGFLLQQKVVDVLQSHLEKPEFCHHWSIEASELPVSIPNGEETRIDFVLRRGTSGDRPWRIVMECKRSSRDYKKWVFFGETIWKSGPSNSNYHFEFASLRTGWNHQGDPDLWHRIETVAASKECPIFDYYLEARINRAKESQRSSSTTAIEDSFQQVTLGQAGLALRLTKEHELFFHIVPVVVTTADLMSAHFPIGKVSLHDGMVQSKDLKLKSCKWLAVNYRINDSICQYSGINPSRTKDMDVYLASRQVRTVFVTQANHLQDFLVWLDHAVNGGTR